MGALSRQVHCKAFEMVERTVSQSSLMSRAQDHTGCFFASNASRQRGAHKHHRSPDFNPGKPNSGMGVERSLPRDLENSRKSEVNTTQTV